MRRKGWQKYCEPTDENNAALQRPQMRGSQLPIAEQLPYSGGPGMPGPYNSINIGSLLFIKYLLQY